MLSLAVEEARADADHLLYGSVPGRARAGASSDAGQSAAVIANADGGPPAGADERHREAALAMMDEAGRVRWRHASAAELNVVDPAAPGGRRMDPAAVLAAFDDAWSGPDAGDAVLVEMSDLERADRDGLPPTGPEREAGLAEPLAAGRRRCSASSSSASISTRDRVIVVSPAAPGGFGRLTTFAHGGAGDRAGPGAERHHAARRLRDAARRRRDGARLARPRRARRA